MRKIMNKENVVLTGKEVAIYVDKYGILHASERAENVKEYAASKVMVTDEFGAEGGYVIINGIKTVIYGAGNGYVYLDKYAREHDVRYITLEDTYHVDGKVTVDKKILPKAIQKVMRIANEVYLQIVG